MQKLYTLKTPFYNLKLRPRKATDTKFLVNKDLSIYPY